MTQSLGVPPSDESTGLFVNLNITIPWEGAPSEWAGLCLAFVDQMKLLGLQVDVTAPSADEIEGFTDELEAQLKVANASETERRELERQLVRVRQLNDYRRRWAM